jgi:hypothetical protein
MQVSSPFTVHAVHAVLGSSRCTEFDALNVTSRDQHAGDACLLAAIATATIIIPLAILAGLSPRFWVVSKNVDRLIFSVRQPQVGFLGTLVLFSGLVWFSKLAM